MPECAPFNIGTRRPTHAQRLDRACRLVALTRAAGALLIVNDSIDIAMSSGADGVHLGRDDGDVAHARRRLPDQLLGVSCYNQLDRARAAIAAGADAVAFGSIYRVGHQTCRCTRAAVTAVRCAGCMATAAHHCDRRHQCG